MKLPIIKYSFFLLILAFIMSCTDFFSTTLAPWAVRDLNKLIPNVTTDNVDELVAALENNPDGSLTLLHKISDAANGASGEDLQKLQEAAVSAAVNASGLGQAVLSSIDTLEGLTDGDQAMELLTNALDAMTNLEEASSVLLEILKDGDIDDFLDSSNVNDLVMAVALLIAGEAKTSGDPVGYFENYNGSGTSDAEVMAETIIDAITERKDELSDFYLSLLEGLGFNLDF